MVEVVVTGVGMHSPVGTHAGQTCAALRAGVSRLAGWRFYGHAGESLVVGALAADGRDAAWVEKAVPAVTPALYEALWQAGLYDHSYHRRRVGLYFASPPSTRVVHPELQADFREHLGEVWSTLAKNDRIVLVPRAQVGGAIALAEASAALADGELDAAVVAGFESQLDALHLDELLVAGRLHTADRAAGVVPGEAAAVCVLETADAARRRHSPVLARLAALALEQEPDDWSPRRPSQAVALARALQAALAAAGVACHRVIADHNGERWRPREWALAEPRALGDLPHGWRTWLPVEGIGDPGAAFVPLAVGWAAQAFARNYAGPGGILVGAMNDTGERAALVLTPP